MVDVQNNLLYLHEHSYSTDTRPSTCLLDMKRYAGLFLLGNLWSLGPYLNHTAFVFRLLFLTLKRKEISSFSPDLILVDVRQEARLPTDI